MCITTLVSIDYYRLYMCVGGHAYAAFVLTVYVCLALEYGV